VRQVAPWPMKDVWGEFGTDPNQAAVAANQP